MTGEAVVFVVVTRNMEPAQRRVVIGHRMQFSSVHGLPDTTRFGATMTCAAKNTDGTADCDVPEARITKSIAEWKAQPVEYTSFTMRGEDLSDPKDRPEIQAEKRTWYKLGRTLFVEGENGKVSDAPVLSTEARCDEADYVQGSKCVFQKPALFFVDLQDPATRDYGRLVSRAIHAPVDKLYPGRAEGDNIPGWLGDISALRTYPLTRTHHQAAQDASKTRSEYYCARGWGPDWHTGPNELRMKCAVYPFNSTRDGAGHHPGHVTGMNPSFAVLPLPEKTFLAMEDTVNDFISRHHILDGDQYWIWLLE
ncbi:transporter [Amycolatopsis speibonae]|uniref:Transporter n=1 Tax=Amycolatopsis speibonae TaxID=1450224 RepID=A0ABV7NVC0_9PSEU